MVVHYTSAANGSWKSFFFVTPRLLFHRRGSALTSVWPQILISTLLGVLACYWNPLKELPDDAKPLDAFNILTFLLSFLLVFKTQSAYNQHWTAITTVENLMAVYRELGMGACTCFDWDASPAVKGYSRKVLRLIVLHFCVMLEYFRRSGNDCTDETTTMDRLRKDIQLVTGPKEYKALYPTETHEVSGSASQYPHTHPITIVFWIDLVLARCHKAGGQLSAPHGAAMSSLTSQLLIHFRSMDQIDKTQFPLPYAQLVKVVLTLWVFTLPFVLQLSAYGFTPFAMFVISLALFGLDEVAEIMESPFGMDPNDIYLEEYREELVNDLELMFHGREMRMDQVFTDDNELCLRGISQAGTSLTSQSSFSTGQWALGWRRSSSKCGRPCLPVAPPAVLDIQMALREVIEDAARDQFKEEFQNGIAFDNPFCPPDTIDSAVVGGFDGDQKRPGSRGSAGEDLTPGKRPRGSFGSTLEVPTMVSSYVAFPNKKKLPPAIKVGLVQDCAAGEGDCSMVRVDSMGEPMRRRSEDGLAVALGSLTGEDHVGPPVVGSKEHSLTQHAIAQLDRFRAKPGPLHESDDGDSDSVIISENRHEDASGACRATNSLSSHDSSSRTSFSSVSGRYEAWLSSSESTKRCSVTGNTSKTRGSRSRTRTT